MRLDPALIALQVSNLVLQHPELAEDAILRADMVEGETEAFDFLTLIVRAIEDAKALQAGTAERLEELKARKDRFGRRIEGLRELAFKIMQAADLAKAELPEATLSLRAGTQQLVGDADPKQLPDSLCKISRDLDRTKIKDALKTGQTVPGFELSNASPSLTIRIK